MVRARNTGVPLPSHRKHACACRGALTALTTSPLRLFQAIGVRRHTFQDVMACDFVGARISMQIALAVLSATGDADEGTPQRCTAEVYINKTAGKHGQKAATPAGCGRRRPSGPGRCNRRWSWRRGTTRSECGPCACRSSQPYGPDATARSRHGRHLDVGASSATRQNASQAGAGSALISCRGRMLI